MLFMRTVAVGRGGSVALLLALVLLLAPAVVAERTPDQRLPPVEGPWPCQPGASATAICGNGITCEWMGRDVFDRNGNWYCAYGGTDCMMCYSVVVIHG